MPSLTQTLCREYRELFDTCRIRLERAIEVENSVNRLIANRDRYIAVGGPLKIPWFFIATVHCLESSFDFRKHLHNGDPLTSRTVNHPSDRPVKGEPPFTWEESASDALQFEKLHLWRDWTMPGLLYKLEAYNGFGYRKRQLSSPYLWSFSEHYASGKFIKDGSFSQSAVSKQCGGAVLLRRMAERGIIEFDREGDPLAESGENDPETGLESFAPLVRYSESGPTQDMVLQLQRALNRLPGIFLKEDGVPGPRTSAAFKKVTGHYLPGDPREAQT